MAKDTYRSDVGPSDVDAIATRTAGYSRNFVLEAVAPPVAVTVDAKAPIERAPSLVALVVASDVVSEQVVGEQDVAGLAPDLDRLGPGDRGIALCLIERTGTVLTEVGGVRSMSSRPDPQVPAVLPSLIREQHSSKQAECRRHRSVVRVAVEVRTSWSV